MRNISIKHYYYLLLLLLLLLLLYVFRTLYVKFQTLKTSSYDKFCFVRHICHQYLNFKFLLVPVRTIKNYFII